MKDDRCFTRASIHLIGLSRCCLCVDRKKDNILGVRSWCSMGRHGEYRVHAGERNAKSSLPHGEAHFE